MRRSTNGGQAALASFLFVAVGCSAAPPRWGAAAATDPACPRDAVRDPSSGRCECTSETVPVLGACVPPAVGDSFCGAAARISHDGCTFRSCADGEVLDIASGSCVAGALPEAAVRCSQNAVGLVENGQPACVPPDAACPRGTLRAGTSEAAPGRGRNLGGQAGRLCIRPPRCPPGTLPERDVHRVGFCRPMTTITPNSGRRVDVGAWVAIALGIDEGPGSPELCRPLAQRPALFALGPGQILPLRIRVSLTIPNQDLARLHAEVTGVAGSGRQASLAAGAAIESAVATLLEPLRSLGGESSAAALETSITCEVARLPEGP
jgi:hypothetical protein